MKKLYLFTLLALFAITFNSCKAVETIIYLDFIYTIATIVACVIGIGIILLIATILKKNKK